MSKLKEIEQDFIMNMEDVIKALEKKYDISDEVLSPILLNYAVGWDEQVDELSLVYFIEQLKKTFRNDESVSYYADAILSKMGKS